MIVVSDASPLIALATIDQLQILRELYANIIIPQAVYEEVVISGAGRGLKKSSTQAGSIRNQPKTLPLIMR